jgi:hypothetical protein
VAKRCLLPILRKWKCATENKMSTENFVPDGARAPMLRRMLRKERERVTKIMKLKNNPRGYVLSVCVWLILRQTKYVYCICFVFLTDLVPLQDKEDSIFSFQRKPKASAAGADNEDEDDEEEEGGGAAAAAAKGKKPAAGGAAGRSPAMGMGLPDDNRPADGMTRKERYVVFVVIDFMKVVMANSLCCSAFCCLDVLPVSGSSHFNS